MDPLFTLPTQASPPFGRATNFELKKVLLETPLNPNVQTGRHVFSFQNTSAEWWVPSKSYLRLRLAYERMDSSGLLAMAPCLQDMIAPVMNPCAHLFQRIEYYIDGNRVSDIQDHIAQIDTLKYRTTRSTSHLDTFGEVSNWMQPDFRIRQHRIASGRRQGAFPLVSSDQETPAVATGGGGATNQTDARHQLGTTYIGANSTGTLNTAERAQFEAESLLPKLIWDCQNFPNDISRAFPDHRQNSEAPDARLDEVVQAVPVLIKAANMLVDHYIMMFEPRVFSASVGFTGENYARRLDVVGSPDPALLSQETKQGNSLGVESHAGYLNLATALGLSTSSLSEFVGGSLIMRNLQPGSILIGTGTHGRTSSACTATITDIYYGPERVPNLPRSDIPSLNPNNGESKVAIPAISVTALPTTIATSDVAVVQVNGMALAAQVRNIFNDPELTISATSQAAFVPMGIVLHIPGLVFDEKNSSSDEIISATDRIVRSFSRRLSRESFFGGFADVKAVALSKDVSLSIHVAVKAPAQLSAERTPTSVANQFELCWLPPLGIFSVGHALPPTRHRLEFTVANDFQARMIEFGDLMPWDTADAITRIANPGSSGQDVANKFRVRIIDMSFFAAMVTGPRSDDVNFVLDFAERKMIQYQIPATQMNQPTAYNFNISPTSTDVTVAFQSTFAGRGVQSLSKFHVPTKSKPFGCETALKRFYVNFNGQNRPREENESILTKTFPALPAPVVGDPLTLNLSGVRIAANGNSIVTTGAVAAPIRTLQHLMAPGPSADTKQFFTQRYVETMLNTSMMFSSGGCESFHTWLERGAYYHWVWPRDGADLSTTFTVFVEFFQAASNTNMTQLSQIEESQQMYQVLVGKDRLPNTVNLCIFDKNLRNFTLTIQNGNVTYCEASNSFTADGVRRPRVA